MARKIYKNNLYYNKLEVTSNPIIDMFINYIMLSGKKNIAKKILLSSLPEKYSSNSKINQRILELCLLKKSQKIANKLLLNKLNKRFVNIKLNQYKILKISAKELVKDSRSIKKEKFNKSLSKIFNKYLDETLK